MLNVRDNLILINKPGLPDTMALPVGAFDRQG